MKAVIFFSGLAGLLIFGPPVLKSRSHHADVRVIVHEATHDHAQVDAKVDVNVEWNGQDNCRFEAERSFTVSANPLESLRLMAGSGSLEVVGVEGLNEIQAVARACASSQDFLDDLQLTSDVSDGSVVVETIYPDMNGWGGGNRYARLDLLVEVPAGLDADIQDGSGEMILSNLGSVHVEDGSGEVVIRGIQGDLTIDDGSGELEITGVQGTVMVEDGSGEVVLEDVGSDVEIHDSSGQLTIRGIGGSVTLHDSSGEVEIRDVVGTVRVVSDSSGDLDVRGVGGDFVVERDGSGDIHFEAVEGTVQIPKKKKRGR